MSSWDVLNPKKCSHFAPEDDTGSGDCDREKDHGPDAEGLGEIGARPEGGDQGVDGFGDGIMLLLLGEDELVRDFEHREGEGEEGSGDEIRGD